MNIDSIIAQLDKLFDEGKMDRIEPFLTENYTHALDEKEYGCALSILNELIGYYREMTMKQKAKETADKILDLLEKAGLLRTIEAGTSYVNIANAYRFLGLYEESENYYQKAESIYKELLDEDDMRMAGLYNNLSNLYSTVDNFALAAESLEKAKSIVEKHEECKIQLATTYTNLGQAYIGLGEYDMAKKALEKSEQLFDAFASSSEWTNMDSHYCGLANAFGTLYSVTNDYNKAIEYYEKALLNIYDTVGITDNYRLIYDNLMAAREKAGKEKFSSMLDLCEAYYEEYGKPMLKKCFPEYLDKIAVGLAGEGSECFGYEDEISFDHDCGPGFSMWVTKETFDKIGDRLNDEYSRLPRIYAGRVRNATDYGKARKGVCIIEDFFERILGTAKLPESESDWLDLDEAALACATNGRVFVDKEGVFSEKRNHLLRYYPEKLWYRKLAQSLTVCAQTGQYNYGRMMARGEFVTARIILDSYVKELILLTFLINKKYCPYYKWMHKAMKELAVLPELAYIIEAIYDMPAQRQAWEGISYSSEPNSNDMIAATIEIVAKLIVNQLNEMGLSKSREPYLEVQGKEVIKYMERNEVIEKIVEAEWKAFDITRNEGGRASCQNDWRTFSIMRKSQYMTWPDEMLDTYLKYFTQCFETGRNLITEKYGRMMESTAKDKYEKIKEAFVPLGEERIALQNMITSIQVSWMEEFANEYPLLAGNARSIHTEEDNENNTSYETYLRGELGTYSEELIGMYGRFVLGLAQSGENLAYMTMNNTVRLYGYSSLDEAENALRK